VLSVRKAEFSKENLRGECGSGQRGFFVQLLSNLESAIFMARIIRGRWLSHVRWSASLDKRKKNCAEILVSENTFFRSILGREEGVGRSCQLIFFVQNTEIFKNQFSAEWKSKSKLHFFWQNRLTKRHTRYRAHIVIRLPILNKTHHRRDHYECEI